LLLVLAKNFRLLFEENYCLKDYMNKPNHSADSDGTKTVSTKTKTVRLETKTKRLIQLA
jgi:hypothetical protein